MFTALRANVGRQMLIVVSARLERNLLRRLSWKWRCARENANACLIGKGHVNIIWHEH